MRSADRSGPSSSASSRRPFYRRRRHAARGARALGGRRSPSVKRTTWRRPGADREDERQQIVAAPRAGRLRRPRPRPGRRPAYATATRAHPRRREPLQPARSSMPRRSWRCRASSAGAASSRSRSATCRCEAQALIVSGPGGRTGRRSTPPYRDRGDSPSRPSLCIRSSRRSRWRRGSSTATWPASPQLAETLR